MLFVVAIAIGVVTLFLTIFMQDLSSTFNIIMSIVFIALICVPLLLNAIFRFHLPDYISIFYYIFIMLSTLAGTIYGLYNYFEYYDIILHGLSGVLLAGLGLYLNNYLNNKCKSVVFVVLFIIGIAVIGGVLWELWEYFGDEFLGLNSQRHTDINGVAYVGHAALADTMYDLLSDLLGAVLFSIGYGINIVYKKKN